MSYATCKIGNALTKSTAYPSSIEANKALITVDYSDHQLHMETKTLLQFS